jgi:O-antigen/teichoic acid export membrane protein
VKKALELSIFYTLAMIISIATTIYISNNVPPSTYAVLGVFNWVLGLLSAFCLLSMPAVIRLYWGSQEYNGVVKTNFFYSISLVIFIASLMLIFPTNFSIISNLEPSWFSAVIIGIVYVILMSYCQTVFQCEDRFSALGLLMMVRPFFLILFAFLLLKKGGSSNNLLSVINFTQVISLAFMLIIFIKTAGFKNPFSISQNREVLNFVGPLVPHTILGYLSLGIDRYLATLFLTLEEVGVYFLIFAYCSILSVIGDVGTKLYQNWLYPVLSNKSYSQSQIRNKVRWLLFLVILFFIISYFVLGFVLRLLLPEGYTSGLSLYPFFLLGISFSFIYIIYIQFVVFFKKTVILPLITGLSVAVSSICGITFYLYLDLGIYSFVIGYMSGQGVSAILAFATAQYYLKRNAWH